MADQTGNVNNDWKPKAIMIGLGVLVLIIIGAVWMFGTRGITKVLIIILQICLFLGALFLLAYLFYFLFIKKQKFDVNYVNMKKLVDAGTRIKRPLLKDLYLSGDKGHTRALVGSIIGYVRIQVLIKNYIYKEVYDKDSKIMRKELVMVTNEQGEKVAQYTLEKQEQDVFIVKNKGLASLFQDPMVIRVHPSQHNDLVGDVDLFGFSLVPRANYWFLNSDFLDVGKVDYSILREAKQTIAFTTMSDIHELIQISIGLDGSHKKKIEGKSLVDIPETRGAGQSSQFE